MKKHFNLLTLFLYTFLGIPAIVFADVNPVITAIQQQTKNITGTVVDETGEPLIGANILVVGSTTGAISDINGKFQLSTAVGATIRISFVGYLPQDVKIGSANTYSIVLKEEDSELLDEVVVVGYGSIKKSDITGSVSSVNSEEMLKRNPITLVQGLQGVAAGVSVFRNSGSPAGDATIRIRGVATVNGSADPLYVVDGVQVGTSITFLNPSDVQSIEILKDASATAIYGSRGANGVIMITTKNSNKGRTHLDFSANFGIQSPSRTLDVADADLFTVGVRQAIKNDGTQLTNQAWSEQYAGRLNSIDWQKEMSRISLQQTYNLSASGGTENTQSTVSFGYLNNDGIIVFSNFKRLTGRANVTHKIKDFIKMGGSIAFVRTESHVSGNLRGFAQAIPTMDQMDGDGVLMNVPIQYPDGTWGHYFKEGNGDTNKSEDNLYAAAESVSENLSYRNQLVSSANIELNLYKGLTFKTIASYSFTDTDNPTYTPINLRTYADEANPDQFSMSQSQSNKMEVESYFTYDMNTYVHHLNLMAGYSVSRERRTNVNASAREFSAPNIRQISLTNNTSSINGSGGVNLETRFLSYFGRATYSLKDRYLLTATVRRDGSSNFGAGNRFGTFPSASLAWRITEESFMKDQNAFSNLKVRLGWGQTGNAGSSTSLSVDQLSSRNLMYYFLQNEQVVQASGIAQLSEIDTNLKWETNEQTNIGLDFGIMKNSLTISADYFIRDAKDLLLYRNLRPSTGYASIYTNAGHIRNSGVEVSVNYNKRFGDWTFGATVNATSLKNEAIEVGDDIYYSSGPSDGDYWENYSITKNGYPVASYYGWRVDDIFQSQSEIDALNAKVPADEHSNVYQTASTKPGDYKYKDIDGNGWIDENDREVLGHGYPTLNYGLNLTAGYKNWDFSAYLYGVAGMDILSYASAKFTNVYNPSGGYQNVLVEYLQNAWTETNHSTVYPRVTKTNTNHNGQISDAFIKSGDFLRVSNVQIGYTFPKGLTSHAKLDRARIFASVDNLITISSYNKFGDPEIGTSNVLQNGFDGGRYPYSRTIILGLSLQF
ncbi:MAG: TonB-dependent receptor [Mediterranea sp.]|nr:TonB-dependent receptor [Mediterranea sp.]